MNNYSDKIYLYIDNELSESEKLDFERELEVNANLKQELARAIMAENLMQEESFHLKTETEMANLFAKLPENIEQEPIFTPQKTNYFRIFSIAASIIVIISLGIWFFSPPKESALNYYADYQVEGREMSGIADVNVLINTYLDEKEKGNYQAVLDSVAHFQPKDSAETFIYFSLKAGAESHLKKYENAIISLVSAAKYARTPQQKADIQQNRVIVLWEMGKKENANKEMEVLQQMQGASSHSKIKDLQLYLRQNP